MDPERPLQQGGIIQKYQSINGLVNEESVPRLRIVIGIPEDGNSHQQIRGNDGDAGTYRNPGIYICNATAIALKQAVVSIYHDLLIPIRTYQYTTRALRSQNRSPMILPTGSRINTGQLGQGHGTSTPENKHGNHTVYQCHGASLRDGQGHSS